MGYAGYAPGNKIADALSPLQQALRSLPLEQAQDLLELLHKLTQNVIRNPTEEKYRRVKTTNAKMATALAEAPQMLDVLQEMGWVKEEDCVVLPPSVRFAHEVHVVGIIEAKDWFKKEAETEKRRQTRAAKTSDADKEQLRKQLDLDRQEKAAEGPEFRSSVAQKLGDGANIMRAGDIGIGKSQGGG